MFKEEIKKKSPYLLLAVASLISIIIIKFIWNDTPEFISIGSEIGDVLFNLSVGYISALIFYIIQIWIPEVKEQKIVRLQITTPLNRLLVCMESPIKEIMEIYYDKPFGWYNPISFDNISKAEFTKMVRTVKLSEDIGFVAYRPIKSDSTSISRTNPIKEMHNAEKLIEEIKETPFELDFDLLNLLVTIENSLYHKRVKGFERKLEFHFKNFPNEAARGLHGEVIADPLYDYYQLILELKVYMKKNQIQIASDL